MLTYHFGDPYQRGQGLGSFFSGLFKKLIPMTKSFIQSNTGQTLKNVALKSASNFASDVFKGKNIKDSAKENLIIAKEQIGDLIKEKLQPGKKNSKKRKKKQSKNNSKKKFNLLKEDSSE